MRLLFLHQNLPGQFKHLIRALAEGGHDVVFITQPTGGDAPGIRRLTYTPTRDVTPGVHHYLVETERAVLNGQAVMRLAHDLREAGWVPDIVIGHHGWGETLFLKDVFPAAPLVGLFEFFYRMRGADVGFDPEFPPTTDDPARLRIKNAINWLALSVCDVGISPTKWQASVYPPEFQPKLRIIHEGVDTDLLRPDPLATFDLPGGRRLTAADEVVTYVTRSLEPYRGFHVFMRMLPSLLAQRPGARVIIVGGDDVSYGMPPGDGRTWRQVMTEAVPVDPARVHFLGRIPYDDYRRLLQISSLHLYLTYPFVLSWSMLEAMASGCLVLGSNTQPVAEAIEDGVNGYLADFFSVEQLANKAADLLANRAGLKKIREAARGSVIETVDLRTRCLPRYFDLIETLTGRPLGLKTA